MCNAGDRRHTLLKFADKRPVIGEPIPIQHLVEQPMQFLTATKVRAAYVEGLVHG